VSTIAALVAILIAAWMAAMGRRAVAAWLIGEDADGKRGFTRFLARNWNVPVFLYLVGLFLVVATRPDGVIWPVLITSANVLGTIILGVVISGAITRFSARGVHLPENVRLRLPLLERRLNTFVPRALLLVRGLIILVVFGIALDAIGLIDLSAWLAGDFGVRLTGMLASVAMILVASFLVWLGLTSWIDYRLNPEYGSAPTARETTLLSLLKNAATIVLLVITLMFVLSEIGIDIAPLIASAGVLGLAIGFGAQKMVQDIITGIFIQFENAINVGDVVTLGGTTGVVEKLTIRSVSLRDVDGAFHIIPFSSVDMVSNYVKDYGNFVYRENVDDAKQAMLDAFDELKTGEFGQHIMEDLQWFGVQSLGDSAVVLRARIKCDPGMQWAVGRAYNEICKRIFDERDIEIPFPHQTIYFGVDKKGEAPPMRMQIEKTATAD
jgi:small conductance mechanosensitive channel